MELKTTLINDRLDFYRKGHQRLDEPKSREDTRDSKFIDDAQFIDLEEHGNLDSSSSERNLWASVIRQAVRDIRGADQKESRLAFRFLRGEIGILEEICSWLDLDDKKIIKHFREEKNNERSNQT